MLSETEIEILIQESAFISTEEFQNEMQTNVKKALYFFLQRMLVEEEGAYLYSHELNDHVIAAMKLITGRQRGGKFNIDGFFGKMWTERNPKMPSLFYEIFERPEKTYERDSFLYRIRPTYYLMVRSIFLRLGFEPLKLTTHPIVQRSLFENKAIASHFDEMENFKYHEGSIISVLTNKYERNRAARRECILHYGYKCIVCKKSLEEIYGSKGRHIIHVHHLVPISNIKQDYKLNPVADLRPVCPNCHTIIHSQEPIFSIEEVQGMLLIPGRTCDNKEID